MFSLWITILMIFVKIIGFVIISYFVFVAILLLIVKTKNKDRMIKILIKPKKLPIFIDFFRWIVIDLLRGKDYPVWGIYMFVAKPGNGKTISMTEHIERVKKEHKNIKVFTNFRYKNQDGEINCWQDIVDAPDNCIIAVDELHMLASSGAWQDFPIELLGEITQNRHSRKQFVTSTQDYDLVNVNFKRVCNYIVLCKNIWGLDRMFSNHYFDRGVYESKSFLANIKKCNFSRYFVASDDTYARYNTLEKISVMIKQIDQMDSTDFIKKLKTLTTSTELIPKETKYIQSIIDRINNDMKNKQIFLDKEKELKSLREKLLKYEPINAV